MDLSNLKKGEDYVNLTEINDMYLRFIQPNGGFDKQLQSADGKDNIDFERGAVWGMAIYLLHISCYAPKYKSESNPFSEAVHQATKEIYNKVLIDVQEEKRKYGHKNIRCRKKLEKRMKRHVRKV